MKEKTISFIMFFLFIGLGFSVIDVFSDQAKNELYGCKVVSGDRHSCFVDVDINSDNVGLVTTAIVTPVEIIPKVASNATTTVNTKDRQSFTPLEVTPVEVIPNVLTIVSVSNMDINRIVCYQGLVRDVIFSKEKSVSVRILSDNVFVKFLIKRSGDVEDYVSNPVEMYILCADKVYNLILNPFKIPATTVVLKSLAGVVEKGVSLYSGLMYEQKIVAITKSVYTNDIPTTFVAEKFDKKEFIFVSELSKKWKIALHRSYLVEGEGFRVKEFLSTGDAGVILQEKDIVNTKLITMPISVFIDSPRLPISGGSKIIVIEKVETKGDR